MDVFIGSITTIKQAFWSVDLSGSELRLLAGPLVLDQDAWFGVYGYVDWNDRIGIHPAVP